MRVSPIIAALAGVALLAVPEVAAGKKAAAKDRGSIVYGKDKALWQVAVDGGEASPFATLGFAAKRVTAISRSGDGAAFLVSTEENHYWVKAGRAASGSKDVPVVRHVCRGRATMSLDGMTVLCQDKDGKITVEGMGKGGVKRMSAARGKLATLAKNNIGEVILATGSGIEAVSIGAAVSSPEKRRTLSVLAPDDGLLIAPNGKRAVAVFAEQGGGTGLYGFLLDGKGVRRKLVTDAVPVAWSSDSKWLVVTRQNRACVVRGAGGQYRCFDGYRALGISPDKKEALLASGKSNSLTIYRADLGGARSSTPVSIVSHAEGAAVWLAPK